MRKLVLIIEKTGYSLKNRPKKHENRKKQKKTGKQVTVGTNRRTYS